MNETTRIAPITHLAADAYLLMRGRGLSAEAAAQTLASVYGVELIATLLAILPERDLPEDVLTPATVTYLAEAFTGDEHWAMRDDSSFLEEWPEMPRTTLLKRDAMLLYEATHTREAEAARLLTAMYGAARLRAWLGRDAHPVFVLSGGMVRDWAREMKDGRWRRWMSCEGLGNVMIYTPDYTHAILDGEHA